MYTEKAMENPTLVQMDPQGRVVLPRDLRTKGRGYYTCQAEEDGTVHLIPVVGVITSKQAYFWTRRWQQGEKEASRALKKRKYKVISPQKLDDYLKTL